MATIPSPAKGVARDEWVVDPPSSAEQVLRNDMGYGVEPTSLMYQFGGLCAEDAKRLKDV